MSLPVISVVITTYNYGRFVEECVDSVLAQDYPSDRVEVIVVDDGSTDDTAERVKRYGTRIEYLRKANGGQASALNAGFAKARGEIISLLDADDYFLPGKLASAGNPSSHWSPARRSPIRRNFCGTRGKGLAYRSGESFWSGFCRFRKRSACWRT